VGIALAYLVLGHVNYWPVGSYGANAGTEIERPRASSGDEPHYLVITNSLLFDHDLRLDEDFARIKAGGSEAGVFWRHLDFGGHSLLWNRRTGRNVTCSVICTEQDAAKLGAPLAELEQYPAHPIAYSAFMALLALPFHPSRLQVEPLVGTFSIFVSIAGVLLAYAVSRKSGFGPKPSLAAALLLGFASSWLPYERAYFSDPSIGLFLLLGFLALRSGRPGLAGLGVGVAMAMKPVFLLFGIAWILERAWARKWRDAFWLTGTIGISGVVLLTVNMLTIHAPMTAGAIPFFPAQGLKSFKETLYSDPAASLFLFVPWAVIPFFWGPFAARPGAVNEEGLLTVDARRQIVIPMFLSLLAFSIVGWGPGFCYGPRYWIPVLPFMAMLAIDFAIAGRPWRRAGVGLLAAVSGAMAITAAVQYHWLFMKDPLASVFGPLSLPR
jgi:hypothetical protein